MHNLVTYSRSMIKIGTYLQETSMQRAIRHYPSQA
jgi:hypothetical protein